MIWRIVTPLRRAGRRDVHHPAGRHLRDVRRPVPAGPAAPASPVTPRPGPRLDAAARQLLHMVVPGAPAVIPRSRRRRDGTLTRRGRPRRCLPVRRVGVVARQHRPAAPDGRPDRVVRRRLAEPGRADAARRRHQRAGARRRRAAAGRRLRAVAVRPARRRDRRPLRPAQGDDRLRARAGRGAAGDRADPAAAAPAAAARRGAGRRRPGLPAGVAGRGAGAGGEPRPGDGQRDHGVRHERRRGARPAGGGRAAAVRRDLRGAAGGRRVVPGVGVPDLAPARAPTAARSRRGSDGDPHGGPRGPRLHLGPARAADHHAGLLRRGRRERDRRRRAAGAGHRTTCRRASRRSRCCSAGSGSGCSSATRCWPAGHGPRR